ncbi:MAG: hypothetical protein ACXWQO_04160 [Bdellovibrionota bacterium]
MSKILSLSFVALLFSLTAQAGIYPIFSKEGNQATLMLSGIGHDPDAEHLFETLAAGQEDEQGKFTKKVKYTDPAGIQAFSVVCVFSKLVPGNGSCTVVMHAAAGMMIDKDKRTFTYVLSDPSEASKMALVFLPAASGVVYRSANGRFEAIAERNQANAVTRFQISYR